MSKTFLAGFKAGRRRYEQTADIETEDVFIHEQGGALVYHINPGGWVYNKHNAIAGRFRTMDNKCWYYTSKDGSMRLNTKFTDLIEAERDVFGVLLGLGYTE